MKNIIFLLLSLLLLSSCEDVNSVKYEKTDTYITKNSAGDFAIVRSSTVPHKIKLSDEITYEENIIAYEKKGKKARFDSVPLDNYQYDGWYKVYSFKDYEAYYDSKSQTIFAGKLAEYSETRFSWQLIASGILFLLVFFWITTHEDENFVESVSYEIFEFFGTAWMISVVIITIYLVFNGFESSTPPTLIHEILIFLFTGTFLIAFCSWVGSWFVFIKNYYKPIISLIILLGLSYFSIRFLGGHVEETYLARCIPAFLGIVAGYMLRYPGLFGNSK